jgi:class 3 adenylate cyclase
VEPQIQYATTKDGVSIAYYAIGQGPALLYLPLPLSNVDAEWKVPPLRVAYSMAAQRSTFIRMDPRGFGLSDRNVDDYSLDAMVSDIEAVVDRIGLATLAIFAFGGFSSAMAISYAARHPDMVTHLILNSPGASGKDLGSKRLMALRTLATIDWELASETAMRALTQDPDAMIKMMAELQRASVEPEAFFVFWDQALQWDADDAARSLRVPTLILHSRSNPDPEMAVATRRIAGLIPNARLLYVENPFAATQAVTTFLGGESIDQPERDQPALVEEASTAVILFADIVDSTRLTEELGDEAFRSKARQLDGALRAVIQQSGGTAIDGKLLGDGVLSVFNSARQALSAATSCGQAGDVVGLGLHLGLHAGDVIREDGNVFGGAVNIAARIAAESVAGEVLVSQTVRDLARTSANVSFEERGERELKGVGEPVRVWAVRSL